MIKRYRAYVVIAIVFTVSAFLAYVIPGGKFFQQLATIPLVGSLMALLVKILLDEASYQRDIFKLELSQQHELLKLSSLNKFSLAVSSHMANVAFDKHAAFSEKYAEKTHEALLLLFREGPTEKALEAAMKLYVLRQEFTVWLTKSIDEKLNSFEETLRRIGNKALARKAGDDAYFQNLIGDMYKTFAEAMGFEEWNNEKITEERALIKIIQHLRSILGTEELTQLRQQVAEEAVARLSEKGG
jgi:hypothetical protein